MVIDIKDVLQPNRWWLLQFRCVGLYVPFWRCSTEKITISLFSVWLDV